MYKHMNISCACFHFVIACLNDAMLMHMFSFRKLLAMYVLDAFILLETPKLKNIGLLILHNSTMLK